MGNVVSAGVGQAPGPAGLNSGGHPARGRRDHRQQGLRLGHEGRHDGRPVHPPGEEDLAAPGGMESMTKAPFLVEKLRAGHRYGNTVLADAILKDGLIDPYSGVHMGDCGEACAESTPSPAPSRTISRRGAISCALEAQNSGAFKEEIVEIDGIILDEEPARGKPEKAARLKPAFKEGGTITAFNASKINDGAAALILASAKGAAGKNPGADRGLGHLQPGAPVVHHRPGGSDQEVVRPDRLVRANDGPL